MDSNEFFAAAIAHTRANFDNARRSGVDFLDSYHSCQRGFWARFLSLDRRFDKFYEDQPTIYQYGQIVWGAIVQANSLLFRPGSHDCPAVFLYSLDPRMDAVPEFLVDWAHGLFDIKGVDTDPDLQAFSDKLADEMVADWKLPVPTRITEGVQCYYTTNMIFRRHLPDRLLAGPIMPLLVCPDQSEVAFILPSRYWSNPFVEEVWRE